MQRLPPQPADDNARRGARYYSNQDSVTHLHPKARHPARAQCAKGCHKMSERLAPKDARAFASGFHSFLTRDLATQRFYGAALGLSFQAAPF
jgi:hypothetical protein